MDGRRLHTVERMHRLEIDFMRLRNYFVPQIARWQEVELLIQGMYVGIPIATSSLDVITVVRAARE